MKEWQAEADAAYNQAINDAKKAAGITAGVVAALLAAIGGITALIFRIKDKEIKRIIETYKEKIKALTLQYPKKAEEFTIILNGIVTISVNPHIKHWPSRLKKELEQIDTIIDQVAQGVLSKDYLIDYFNTATNRLSQENTANAIWGSAAVY